MRDNQIDSESVHKARLVLGWGTAWEVLREVRADRSARNAGACGPLTLNATERANTACVPSIKTAAD
jgi:hypothetical protein